jgi:hypothetical protein
MLEEMREDNWKTEGKLYYDFSGSAYHDIYKLREYQLFDETYDIRFFAGAEYPPDKLHYFYFVKGLMIVDQLGFDIMRE